MNPSPVAAPAPANTYAPPLNDELLARYKVLTESAKGPVKDSMKSLLKLVMKWWLMPTSSAKDAKTHLAGTGLVIPLEKKIQEDLFEDIPWEHELKSMCTLFEELPQGELRNAAFHLAWHGIELFRDREPITVVKHQGVNTYGHTDQNNELIGK